MDPETSPADVFLTVMVKGKLSGLYQGKQEHQAGQMPSNISVSLTPWIPLSAIHHGSSDTGISLNIG